MVVITLELVPPRLRGALTRWLTEVATGVYVGRVTALVRDLLWDEVVEEAGTSGRVVMVYRTNNEQGYSVRMEGDSRRKVVELDGLQLVANQHAAWRDWVERLDDDEDGEED